VINAQVGPTSPLRIDSAITRSSLPAQIVAFLSGLVRRCQQESGRNSQWRPGRRFEGTEENKMLVRRQFDEIWNGANWATVDELYAPNYVNHDPYNPDQGTGSEGFKQRVEGYRSVLHGFDLRIERQIAEGDIVETHWSLRGTHGGPLEGTAPTGKSVYVDGQLLSRIVDGKFVEEWVH
jgi:predicted ester cyclase